VQNSTPLTVRDGVFAASVYEAAKSRYPEDFHFLLHFLLTASSLSWAVKLERHIHKDLCNSFPEHAAHLVLAYKRAFRPQSRDTFTYLAQRLSLREGDEKFQKLFVALDDEKRNFTSVEDCLQDISKLSSLHSLILSRRNFNMGSKQYFAGAIKARSWCADAIGQADVYTYGNRFGCLRCEHTSTDNDYLSGRHLFSPRGVLELRSQKLNCMR
jgi:hypothetical protein